MREMRRGYQQVDDPTVLARWLDEATVGRLATMDEHGYPTIKPVNFVFADGRVYFHSATEGEKLDDIRRDARVGFEIDQVHAITPPLDRGCQSHCFYESVVIRGRARVLDDAADRQDKERVLRLLVQKHSPEFADTPLVDVERTAVVEIVVDQMTGKEDFGQRWSAERKLAVARRLHERDGDAARDVIARMGLSMEKVLSSQ